MDECTTSNEGMTRWLRCLTCKARARLTVEAYRRALVHFARWSENIYGQPFDPAQVITRDVRDWKSFQQTVEKAAPATINQRLTAVQRFFDWAETQKLVRANPARGIKGLPSWRTAAQGTHLAENSAGSYVLCMPAAILRDIAMIEVLAGTGLRVSELLALQIEDITIQPRSGIVVVRKGKHDRQRTVPLTASVRVAIQAYLATHPECDKAKLSSGGANVARCATARL